MDLKKIFTVKNVLVAILVPSALAGAYYTYTYLDRRSKQKKLLDLISKAFDSLAKEHTETQPEGMGNVIMVGWDTELKKLSDKAFNAFNNYVSAILPTGKEKGTKSWVYETTNADGYKKKLDAMIPYSEESTKVMEYFNQLAEKLK